VTIAYYYYTYKAYVTKVLHITGYGASPSPIQTFSPGKIILQNQPHPLF